MKKYIVALMLILCVGIGFAQSEKVGSQLPIYDEGKLFKTYSTFTATSDDTTGYVTINVPGWSNSPLACPMIRLLGVATDSVAADVYVVGSNGSVSAITSSYADSIIGTSNTSNTVVITLRAHGTDRMPGCTRFKVSTQFRASGQGTTTGRTMKWYLQYRTQ